jgi:hypothetical protein
MGAATACSSDTTNRPDRGRGMDAMMLRTSRVGNGGFAVAHAYLADRLRYATQE